MSHFFLPLGKLLPKDINFYTSVQAEKSPKVILSCHQKIIKKQTDSALNFPLPPQNSVRQGAPYSVTPLFQRISQSSCQDQQNGKFTYCQLPT